MLTVKEKIRRKAIELKLVGKDKLAAQLTASCNCKHLGEFVEWCKSCGKNKKVAKHRCKKVGIIVRTRKRHGHPHDMACPCAHYEENEINLDKKDSGYKTNKNSITIGAEIASNP